MKNLSLFLILCLSFVLVTSICLASEMRAQFESPPVQITQTDNLEISTPDLLSLMCLIDLNVGYVEMQETGVLQNDKFVGYNKAEKITYTNSSKFRYHKVNTNRTLVNQTYHGSGGLIG